MTVRIVTDSTCDLPAETRVRYGIQIVPLHLNAGKQSYLGGITGEPGPRWASPWSAPGNK